MDTGDCHYHRRKTVSDTCILYTKSKYKLTHSFSAIDVKNQIKYVALFLFFISCRSVYFYVSKESKKVEKKLKE